MNKGFVTLVGAGCSKNLITEKGLSEIKTADAIIYDDLIDQSLLFEARGDCELIYAGKRSGRHSQSQNAINNIIIEKAKEGKKVVRLKGGDSFVFARGGEEILALQKENILYDIVPGVTSCVAVPESMGIPVTHREVSRSFTVVTGHTADETWENFEALAKLKGTLVFLMGLSNLSVITSRLIENGKNKNTPCAVLSKGFSNEEKRFDGTLETICEKAKGAKTPAIIVVGDVCRFDLRNTEKKPLSGVSVAVTGTKHFTHKLSEVLFANGADTVSYPCIDIEPIKENIQKSIDGFEWLVFTSANGVRMFFDGITFDFRKFSSFKFACIGKGSADELSKHGFYADFIPSEYTAKALGKELSQFLKGDEKVLILRAENGSDALCHNLLKGGICFEDRHIYKTKENKKFLQTDAVSTDYTVFASGSGVRAFFASGKKLENSVPVCIGQVTAEELCKYTESPCLVSENHTAEGIMQTIIKKETEK